MWRIEMLGGLRVASGERSVLRIAGEKPALLLAYLAYHRRAAHSRDALADLLWPDADPALARHRLSQTLTTVRKQLDSLAAGGASVLMSDRRCVRLDPTRVSTDVAAFEEALDRARRVSVGPEREALWLDAIDLYSGELLPGSYEPWVLHERERLAERRTAALRTVIALREGRGDLAGALNLARRLLSVDPMAEDAHRVVIRLLVAHGEPAAALRHYREMERSLGMRPTESRGRRDRMAPAPPRPAGGSGSGHAGHGLPVFRTRFFGREAEMEALMALLCGGERLVTLTGPGGSGKTRLAIEVATRLADRGERAVWFVPLVDLADHRRLMEAIRDGLGLPRAPGQEPLEQIMARFRQERALLILDNFEHLIASDGSARSSDGATLLGALIETASTLTCLITSRRRLNLEEEREFLVPPLPEPPSIELFIDRARAARASFAAPPEGAVASLCVALEGIPLAIELAAARAGVLSPEQMLAQMGDRFHFLVSRRREEDARHQTLWAALEWSYRLLSREAQRFFAQLSVFRGGWTLAAARDVCAEPHALDLLEQLRDCSMIEVTERAGEIRFRTLETLREFGWEQLAPEERAALARRHAAFYLALIEELEPALFGADQARQFERVEAEHDNLRAALAWSETATDGLETGLRLSAALWWFWFIRTHLAEGWQWITRALSRATAIGDTPARAKALYGAGGIAWFRGDHPAARRLMEEGVAMWRRLDQPRGLGFALRAFGWVALDQGDLAIARAAGEESLALYRALDDPAGVARSQHFLGRAAYLAGETRLGRQLLEESIGRCRVLGDDLILAWGLEALGKISLDEGASDSAAPIYREVLELSRRVGSLRGVASGLEGLAAVAAEGGDLTRAARLFAAARACRETQGFALLPFLDWRMDHDRTIVAVRARLGAARFSRAWAEGRAWTWEEAIVRAFEMPPGAGGAAKEAASRKSPWCGLSDTEWERARLLLSAPKGRGRPPADDRQTLDGILYVLRSGCRWQDLPPRYGSAVTCWRRWTRWRSDGTWARLRVALPELADF
jgi:predicted ATPase/DNA-binding SARP family transcriptional activator